MKDVVASSDSGAYSKVTKNVCVTVVPHFLEERSDVEAGVYVFTYEVIIENTGSDTIQLLNRHWVVISGGRQYADVKGDGVVGEQPILEPGNIFSYASFTVIAEAVGSMHGSYTFRSESGEFFDVAIPQFDLIYIDCSTIH